MTKVDKLRGMLVGVAIGDALGQPVETWSRQAISKKYGRITQYLDGSYAKAGCTTDDTQLTIAVANGLIQNPFNISIQAKLHAEEFKKSTAGWGGTTREAVRSLINNVSPAQSGIQGEGRGKGNGCCMKISPATHLCFSSYNYCSSEIYNFVTRLSLMTHATLMAVESSFAMMCALTYCLAPYCDFDDGNSFDAHEFIELILKETAHAKLYVQYHKMNLDMESDLLTHLEKLHQFREYDTDRICQEFGNLNCYVANSLPGSLMLFLQNFQSIECLYEAVNAGGDTDTNASMVGALLGALYGISIFPKHLVEELQQPTVSAITKIANQLAKV